MTWYTAVVALLLAPAVTLAGGGGTPDPADTFGLTNIEAGGLALGNRPLITTVTQIINVALGLLGIVAVVIILIGGFRWMTAGGNTDGVDAAKKTIFAGIIGLAIILSAWAIANFVISSLAAATNAGTGL